MRVLFIFFITLSLAISTIVCYGQDSSFVKFDSRINSKDFVRKTRKPFVQSRFVQVTHISVPLIAVGALLTNQDNRFRIMRNQFLPTFKNSFDDYIQFAPAAVMMGLKVAGVEGRSSWGRMLTSDAFSTMFLLGMVNGGKILSNKQRPDGRGFNSFPSGHTATAFMAATLLHKEYGLTRSPWYSIGGYAVATATALGRQMNNRHWVSDVVTGAGVGILSAELGYLMADLIFKDRGLRHELMSSYDRKKGKPSYFGFSLAFSILLNDIKLDDELEVESGIGTSFGVEGAYFINKYVGVGGKASIMTVPLTVNRSELLNRYPNLMTELNNVSVKPLSTISMTVGPYLSLPLSKYFMLNGKALFGYGLSKGSTLEFDLRKNSSYKIPYMETKNTHSGHIGGGVEFVAMINHFLNLRFFGEYLYSVSKVQYSSNNTLSEQIANREWQRMTHNVNMINVGMGFSVMLWH